MLNGRLICVDDGGYVDLAVGVTYERLPDAAAEVDQMVRVVDESGEDYLYPERLFKAEGDGEL